MREILFKAKRKDNNEWVYGSLISNVNKTGRYFIVENGVYAYKNDDEIINQIIEDKVEVIPETICQGTILKNGLKIFEGDIYHHGDLNITYTVVWHDSGLIGKQNKSSSYAGLEGWADRIKIIGNIFDNPELLDKEVK